MLYQTIIDLLKGHSINYREFTHEPILTYEDAEKQAKLHGFKGAESKNVFIKSNSHYYVYLTTAGHKVDFKKLKENLKIKTEIASPEDVKNIINCVPGCVIPFGFPKEITIIIDPIMNTVTDYLFSPGITTKTIQTNWQDLKKLILNLPNKLIHLQ